MATIHHCVTGDILVFRFTSAFNGQVGLNVKFAKVDSATGLGAELPDVGQHLDATYAVKIKPLMTDTAVYLGHRLSLYRIGVLIGEYITTSHGGPGTLGSAPLPSQTRGLITMRTGSAGRKSRGRLYVPFPDQGAQTPPVEFPNLAYQALLDSLGGMFENPATIVSGTGSSTLYFGNPKFTSPPTPKRPVDIPDYFETHVSSPLWATQKRSGDYGKENKPQV